MKYRRRPVDVEAVQFHPDQEPWPDGVRIIHPSWAGQRNNTQPNISYQFAGATVGTISPGDWVVTNQTGERYVVARASFDATYEKVGP